MAEEHGCLSDGTPVRDVAMDMLVEVRFPGDVSWMTAIVVKVDLEAIPVMITVEMMHSGLEIPFSPYYTRKWKKP